MKIESDIFDPYVRRARLQPAMLVALPFALATLAWAPGGALGWSVLWSLLVWCGGTALLAQVARDRGRKKEADLFRSWDGKPTTRLLRHRDTTNATVLSRRHKRLQRLVTGIRIPTKEEERADPKGADNVYEACTKFLLERTRKKDDFPLVFEENCNYGFRRNLWGMKPIGIVLSVVGTLAVAIIIGFDIRRGIAVGPIIPAALVINAALLLGWLFYFKPDWVRTTAEAYAERLLAACEVL